LRKLATIRKITSLTSIPDADRIEVAQVDGWKVVVQKGLHVVGDLVVYFEIDSLLPIREEFEFLRKNSYVKNSQEGEGFRLKTIKMRGQVSQGLIVPIRDLKEFQFIENRYWFDPPEEFRVPLPEFPDDYFLLEVAEGQDVTEVLGVKKYEKIIPAQLAGKIRGNFPSFIRKTDQERIQNFIKPFLTNYRDHEWECSLKLDGSSMTAYYYAPEDRFGVCSRNLDLKETDDNSFWQVARKLNLEEKLRYLHDYHGSKDSFALQGELMGPGIQGNPEQLKELEFFVYDIWDIEAQVYLPSDIRLDVINQIGIKHVPVYETCTYGFDSADGFIEYAEYAFDGKSINNPVREGLVFKSLNDPNVSFKAISNKFLLNGGD
jgi:RNA ligase (TIGR02306 family)